MERIYDTCAGIDVHKKIMVACVRKANGHSVTKGFSTTDEELQKLADWIESEGCEMVAMESTGSYWKGLYNILEEREVPTMVVNAAHIKNVPGRKTDVKDAEWIAKLCQQGLLQPSFIPSKRKRELREMNVLRKKLTDTRTGMVNRIHKVLEGAGIKLSCTMSDIMGKSGRAILNTLVAGEVLDKNRIAAMRKEGLISSRVKASDEEIVASLEGSFGVAQVKELNVLFDLVDGLDKNLEQLTGDIQELMSDAEKIACGHLTTMKGMSDTAAEIVISVIGTNMDQFKTAQRLCSWAGLCPGMNESAGKRRSGKTTKGNKLLRTTLITCAHSAVKAKNSFLAARFNRLKNRIGSKRAYVAIARSMLTAIFHMLSKDEDYKDLGADYFHPFNAGKRVKALARQIKALGYDCTLSPTSTSSTLSTNSAVCADRTPSVDSPQMAVPA